MNEIVESNTASTTAASGIPCEAPCYTPYRRVEVIENCTLYLADCTQLLPMLPDFDLILTDPPYGININKSHRLATSRGFSGEEWDAAPIPDWLVMLLFGKSKYQVIWGGNYYRLPPGRCFLIWDKNNSGRDFADCEYAWTSLDSVARIFVMRPMNMDGGKQHPTQKPRALMEWCLTHVSEAKTVCDPFMGSGTTGVACARKGLAFTGIEREEKYFNIACERIAMAYRTRPRLFDAVKKAAPEQRGLF